MVADDRSVILIRVTHCDPETVAQVTNITAQIFREMIKEMMYDMESSVLDEVGVNAFPQGMKLNVANVAV